MKTFILENLDNPQQLEKYYRENPKSFDIEFHSIYSDIKGKSVADYWFARLNYQKPDVSVIDKKEIAFVVVAAILAGFVAKLPAIFHLQEDVFFQKNISFVVFPFLIAYFLWKAHRPVKGFIVPGLVVLLSAIYINVLPEAAKSDAVFLSSIHLPIVLWMVLGYAFTSRDYRDTGLRIHYLKFNGDYLVMTAVIVAAGMIFTGITVGLFSMIKIDIKEFYFNYVFIWGSASVPLVSVYLLQNNPTIVNKVSPTVARIFTPLVLILLFVYLIAVVYTRKDPYNDREFLLLFNVLLIAVMAIIFFSIAEASHHPRKRFHLIMLLMLSFLSILVNLVALSAIGFRIMQWGISPNRLAVLGSNLLIFIHLIKVGYRLFKSIQQGTDLNDIQQEMVSYLPIYGVWAIFVVFFFPLIFGVH